MLIYAAEVISMFNVALVYFSGTAALKDAGISFNQVEQACVGYAYGMSWQNLTFPIIFPLKWFTLK